MKDEGKFDVRNLVQALRGPGHTSTGTAISFGARQAIIVRNNESRKALPMPEFENAAILTIAECKGATHRPAIILFPSIYNQPTSHSHIYTFLDSYDLRT